MYSNHISNFSSPFRKQPNQHHPSEALLEANPFSFGNQYDPNLSPQFKCIHCTQVFFNTHAFNTHMHLHRETAASRFYGLPPPPQPHQGLNQGETRSPIKSIPNIGSIARYKCDQCTKTFSVPARLTRHYRVHTGEKPFQCEFCKKSFSVKENLAVHRRIHTKERPYACEICGRAFEHSGKLHRHVRIHTGERPHKCEVCGKSFIQSGQLVIHRRTHTGEKPYKCQVCTKAFTCSKQLKVHMRTHTGEKPYHCNICGKSFGYNHVLKLHQVSHFGEKIYKCTLCKTTFNSKKAMERHIRSHTDNNDGPDDGGSVISKSRMSTSTDSGSTLGALDELEDDPDSGSNSDFPARGNSASPPLNPVMPPLNFPHDIKHENVSPVELAESPQHQVQFEPRFDNFSRAHHFAQRFQTEYKRRQQDRIMKQQQVEMEQCQFPMMMSNVVQIKEEEPDQPDFHENIGDNVNHESHENENKDELTSSPEVLHKMIQACLKKTAPLPHRKRILLSIDIQ